MKIVFIIANSVDPDEMVDLGVNIAVCGNLSGSSLFAIEVPIYRLELGKCSY